MLEGITEKYQKELEDIQTQKKEILTVARKEAMDIVKDAGKQVEKTIRDIRESGADKEQTKEARKELQDFVQALEQRKSKEMEARDKYLENKIQQLNISRQTAY